MKIEATTFEEFFKASAPWAEVLRSLDEIAAAALPGLKRDLFTSGSMTMIGYGVQPYKYASGREGEWPLVAIAPQKNYASLYVCVCKDDKYLPEKYAKKLEKVKCGKSCIRFKKIEDLNLEVLAEMFEEITG